MLPRIRNMKLTAKVSKNFLLKLALVFGSIFGVFLMTGLLYFRSDVYITDMGETKQVFTMSENPYEILEENKYELGAYDRVTFSGFEKNVAKITIDRAFEVSIKADGETKTAYSVDGTVGDLLKQCDIQLGEYDSVTPALSVVCKKGVTINVQRAFDVNIVADGGTTTVPALHNSVKDILSRAKVEISTDDIVTPDLETIVTEPTDIKIQRVTFNDYTTRQTTPYNTTTEYDNLLPMGESEVAVEGVDGVTNYTRRKTLVDGVEVSNKVIKTTVVTEKVDEVIKEGTALTTPFSSADDGILELQNGTPLSYKYIVSGRSTAYSAYEGARTASGRYAEIGTVAVDPDVIPFGSKLYIVAQDGSCVYGYAIAADTGGAMLSGHAVVDVFTGFGDAGYYAACNWGVRFVDIYVLEVGNG